MPDEDVAAELERSAGRAQARGGLAAVAAFLERAAALTPEPAHRAQRLLAAAGAKRDAGALEAALGLLAGVEAELLDELGRARVDLLRGQIALEQRRGGDAGRLFLSAASRLEPLDPELARETYLEALAGAMSSDVEVVGGAPAVAEAARAAPTGTAPPRTVDVLLDAFAIRLTDGYAAAAPTLARALELLLAMDVSDEDVGRRLSVSSSRNGNIVALEMWDDEALASPGRSPGAGRPRRRRTRAPAVRAQLPGQEPHARRRPDRGHPDDRRSPLDRRGDRKPGARERPDDSRRMARPRAGSVRADRSHLGGGGRAAMDVQQLREIRALQRPRPTRRRARCRLGSVPARSDRIRIVAGARAGRGGIEDRRPSAARVRSGVALGAHRA